MKIVYFGNADFGIPTLDKLLRSNHSVKAVVTNPDQSRASRGKSKSTPIKKWATNNNIECIEIDNMDDPDFLLKLKKINPDIFIVIAYRIIPEALYNIPKFGAMNLHASLLPNYRGAAPIQRSLLNGDNKTGVTTFIINKGIDKGMIVSQSEISISIDDNFETLHNKLSIDGSELTLESLNILLSKKNLITQKGQTSYAKKIKKSELVIDWDCLSFDIHNRIRAFSPFPGAYSWCKGARIKILSSTYEDGNSKLTNLKPGYIHFNENTLYVGTGNHPIIINQLKIEGKKEMSSTEFYNGYLSNSEIDSYFGR